MTRDTTETVSNIGDDAHVTMFVADFGSVDPGSGKLNALGIAFAFVPPPNALGGAPQSLFVCVDLPQTYAGTQVGVELTLFDRTAGQAVSTLDATGKPQAVRFAQMTKVEPLPNVQGMVMPPDATCRIQTGVQLPNGLLGMDVASSHSYAWQLRLDGHAEPHWEARFVVLPNPDVPQFGGPTGPAPADLPPIA